MPERLAGGYYAGAGRLNAATILERFSMVSWPLIDWTLHLRLSYRHADAVTADQATALVGDDVSGFLGI